MGVSMIIQSYVCTYIYMHAACSVAKQEDNACVRAGIHTH